MLLLHDTAQAQTDESQVDGLAGELLRDGYLIVPNAIDIRSLDRIRDDLEPHFAATPHCRGAFYGAETKRFGSVLKRSPAVARLVTEPTIYGVVEAILGPWCVNLQLNLTQGIEIHPGARVQVPHRDQDMWGGPKGTMEYMVNVMWALEEFTETNGATRIWPRSHKMDQAEMRPEHEAIAAVMPRGSALLYLGSTLHSAGANRSSQPRRGLIVSYCLGWLKPWENQWLAYPPEVARTFEPEVAALAGYRQHLPSLGNYEGQCPSLLLREVTTPAHQSFVDALRDDQNALIDQYYASLPRSAPVLADGP